MQKQEKGSFKLEIMNVNDNLLLSVH